MQRLLKPICCCSFRFLNVAASVFVLLLHSARSETYTVGDDDQWRTGVNYLAWSTKYSFRVGDILVFQYTKSTHNVYQVTADTYRSCNSSNGVLAAFLSGSDRIQLTEAKKYWFICDIEGHCLGGMRFGIDVLSASNNTSGTDPTPPFSPTESCSSQRGAAVLISLIVLLVQLLLGPKLIASS